jgi:L-asparaginase
MPRKIYIAYTGGTIGMKHTPNGYVPAVGYLAEQLAMIRELQDPQMPNYTIHEYDPLLDSSNMTPQDWINIALDIQAQYDQYDGFVVLHGTDTMAYTASALPFMLQGLSKPVILTGSQIPLCELRNDARENLITALLIAADYAIPEVCLYFGGKLLRGCRSVKVHATGFQAFDSPNYPPLGTVGVDIDIHWDQVLPADEDPNRPLRIQKLDDHVVGALRIFPGMSAQWVEKVLEPPLKGLVLEAYGVGNAPSNNIALLDALRRAADRGVVIVDCSQCLYGRVDLGDYETGSALAKAGVISGQDMTVEAALAKLYFLFSAGYQPEDVKWAMGQNLRGELTPLTPFPPS